MGVQAAGHAPKEPGQGRGRPFVQVADGIRHISQEGPPTSGISLPVGEALGLANEAALVCAEL